MFQQLLHRKFYHSRVWAPKSCQNPVRTEAGHVADACRLPVPWQGALDSCGSLPGSASSVEQDRPCQSSSPVCVAPTQEKFCGFLLMEIQLSFPVNEVVITAHCCYHGSAEFPPWLRVCLLLFFILLEGLVRGRSDLAEVASTLALLQVLPETSIPHPSRALLPAPALHMDCGVQICSRDCQVLCLKTFLFCFFLELYSVEAAGVTQHILYYPSHHFNRLILLTFTVATVGIMGSEFPLEWISWVNFLGHC